MNSRSVVLILGCTALLTGGAEAGTLSMQAPALQDAAPETDLKAAFLLNFARFSEWPDNAFARTPGEFHLGVLGTAAEADTVEKLLKGKKVGGRALKIDRGEAPGDLKTCAMVYVTASEKGQIPKLLADFRGLPILTVGETEGFAGSGGILNFYIEENRVRFEINPDAAARAGLTVTRLIGVAPRKVKDR